MKAGDTFIENTITTLACPICKGGLFFAWIARSRGEVQRASIRCNRCGNPFKVVARIPIFLPPDRFADWTHPLVEILFGNIRRSLDELIREYGVEKIKEMYSALIEGDYDPPVIISDSPVDRSLIARGAYRISRREVGKHLQRIDRQCKGNRSIEEQVRRVAELKARTIVDACCGGGFFIASLLQVFQRYEKLFSFDIDYICAKRVEGTFRHSYLIDRSLPMVADARIMPFPSNSIELVTTRYGFGQVLGYIKAVEEAFRVLRPGGHLIATDRRRPRIPTFLTMDEVVRISRFGDIMVDEESFIDSLINAGFSVGEVEEFDDSFLVVCTKPH